MYILASLFLKTGITLSKYITTTNGSDAARLIAFGNLELTETGEFSERNHMLVQHGVNLNKRAVIQFEGAETAVYIFMRVDTSALDLDADSMRYSCLSEHFVPVAASVGIAHRLYHYYYTSQHRIRLSAERSWSGEPEPLSTIPESRPVYFMSLVQFFPKWIYLNQLLSRLWH